MAGQELIWLAEELAQRDILGIDLAPGMVEVARERAADAELRQTPEHLATALEDNVICRRPGSSVAGNAHFHKPTTWDPFSGRAATNGA